MIVHLIDANGHHRYSGDERNPKVARLEGQGMTRVAVALPDTGVRQKWTGSAWIDDPIPGPTDDKIYDQVMQNQKVLKAFALCINDGSIVPGANVSNAALKAAVKAKM